MEQRSTPPSDHGRAAHGPMAQPSMWTIVRAIVSSAFGVWVLAQLQGDLFVTSVGPMMIGAFGATAVLVFGAPYSPLAQPYNVVVGHVLSAVIGVAVFQGTGVVTAWSMALAVSLAIGVMQITRSVHPPGGATALIAVIGAEPVHNLGFEYVLTPVASGAAVLVVSAYVTNNWGKVRSWPLFWLPFARHRADQTPVPLEESAQSES